MEQDVQIKGIREGLLVSLSDGKWEDVQQSLFEEVERQADFLQGAKLILDVQEHEISAAELGKLRDRLSERGISLWAVLSESQSTEETAQNLGLATRIHQTEPEDFPDDVVTEIHVGEATLVKRTLRSGNNLTFPGHVTVIGDVNPGAEVIASGNVIIWGRARGMIHAGAEGDESAVVCALDLSPTQLRIAGHIAIPPEQEDEAQPEMAWVRDGQVIAELWKV